MSRSTNSSGPFGRGTWTTRIFAIANSDIVGSELIIQLVDQGSSPR